MDMEMSVMEKEMAMVRRELGEGEGKRGGREEGGGRGTQENVANVAQYLHVAQLKVESISLSCSFLPLGVINTVDNCPSVANREQADTDNDRRGDICDNCKTVSNFNQVRDCCHGNNWGNVESGYQALIVI